MLNFVLHKIRLAAIIRNLNIAKVGQWLCTSMVLRSELLMAANVSFTTFCDATTCDALGVIIPVLAET